MSKVFIQVIVMRHIMYVYYESLCAVDVENSTNVRKIPALEVHRWGKQSRAYRELRTVDVDTHVIAHGKLTYSEIGGDRDTITLETEDAYKVLCSPDSEIYTVDGWKKAGNIKEGDVIWTNGDPDDRFLDKEWLRQKYVVEGLTQEQIGELCNTPKRTIRAYIKRFGLGKGGVGALYGEDNPAYKEIVSRKGAYFRSYQEYINLGLVQGKCSTCDYVGRTHMHHKNHNPDDTSPENFEELCPKCHRAEHTGWSVRHVRRSVIKHTYNSGTRRCIRLNTESGNIVVEGFVFRGEGHGQENQREQESEDWVVD